MTDHELMGAALAEAEKAAALGVDDKDVHEGGLLFNEIETANTR